MVRDEYAPFTRLVQRISDDLKIRRRHLKSLISNAGVRAKATVSAGYNPEVLRPPAPIVLATGAGPLGRFQRPCPPLGRIG